MAKMLEYILALLYQVNLNQAKRNLAPKLVFYLQFFVHKTYDAMLAHENQQQKQMYNHETIQYLSKLNMLFLLSFKNKNQLTNIEQSQSSSQNQEFYTK